MITAPDERWRRCDIKSVSLLANVLARQRASEAGAFEAWLVDDAGLVTEGTASNAWIVTADGLLLTHDASHAILNGITRRAVLRIAGEHGVVLREGPFSVAEATSAAEAFLTSTTSLIKPVTRIDDAVIGDGRLGPLTARLLDFYAEHVGERGGERGARPPPAVAVARRDRHRLTATGQAGTLAPPQAVLFDWDNTLIDSWAAIQDAQNYTLAYFGLKPWTLDEVRARVRGSMRDTFPAMFGERWREAGEVFYARFTEHHLDALKPLPGAEEMLRSLQESGVYLGVVSNKKGDYLRAEAARLGWQGYFGSIVGAFDAARDKPATDPVLPRPGRQRHRLPLSLVRRRYRHRPRVRPQRRLPAGAGQGRAAGAGRVRRPSPGRSMFPIARRF